ncbi:MAG: NPCBM/NEW2 domain-containing protein [Clostridia bacterium]|nr:NPCBM/NEW2 domain-containing protein [Clostridia bacterium]
MKKLILSILSVIMTVSLLAGASVVAFAADPATPAQPDAFELIPMPEMDKDNWEGKLYGAWNRSTDTQYWLSDIAVKGNIEYTDADGKVQVWQSGVLESSNTITGNTNSPMDYTNNSKGEYKIFGQLTTMDYPYGYPSDKITIGTKNLVFEKGLGVHPKNPAAAQVEQYGRESWTIIDISEYTKEGSDKYSDTFYSAVGITNVQGKKGASPGVIMSVWGDKTGDGQHYELLAESELIYMDLIGEFNVDITGVKLLKLIIESPDEATTHASSATAWAGACLYKADNTKTKPSYTDDYVEPVVDPDDEIIDDDDEIEETVAQTNASSDTTPADDGCGSSVAAGALGVVALVGCAGAITLKKRKED